MRTIHAGLLIRPPLGTPSRARYRKRLRRRTSYPPLALLAIARSEGPDPPRGRSTHAQLDHLEYPEVERRIAAFKPDVVGITCFTVQLVDVHNTIVREACGRREDCPRRAHISDFPHESVGLGCGRGVKGEGQQPMLELRSLGEGRAGSGNPGVIAHVDDPIPENDVYFSNDLTSTRSSIGHSWTTPATTT